mgnify:CR=1 FL=1
MENDITNILTILGKTSDVMRVMSVLLNSERDVSFTGIVPIPSELAERPHIANPKYVNWAMGNWSTKFDASETVVIAPNVVKFLTYGTTPINLIGRLSELHPNVKLKVEYADEDLGFNVGDYTFKSGDVVDVNTFIGGSSEAYEKSMDITNDYYYIEHFIIDLLEGDCDHEFPSMCVKIAYDRRKLDIEYPSFILDMFEGWAVEEEDYEFAEKVKGLKDKQEIQNNIL